MKNITEGKAEMKSKHRVFTLLATTLVITACEKATSPDTTIVTSSTSTTTTTPSTVTSSTLAPTTTMENPPADKPPATGEALAQQSGCFACHAIDRKVVGPAWREVAARYRGAAGARDELIKKVHTGGKGNWTEITGGVAMPPYSPRVSDTDIAALIDFILALPEKPS